MKPHAEDLERLDRLATLGTLLAEVAHEVRNPLVSMKTFLQLLPDHRDDIEFTEDFRKVVLDELGRMERLLDAVLRQAAPESARIAEQSGPGASQLADVLETLARLLEKRAGQSEVKLSTSIEAALPEVAIAQDPLRQIVLNLALNALDAAPASSCVTLRAESGAAHVRFCVEDEGPGVAEELRDRLFEPFFSTREDRTGGLGLAIAKSLIEAAGGDIAVETGYAGGARFVVMLPRSV